MIIFLLQFIVVSVNVHEFHLTTNERDFTLENQDKSMLESTRFSLDAEINNVVADMSIAFVDYSQDIDDSLQEKVDKSLDDTTDDDSPCCHHLCCHCHGLACSALLVSSVNLIWFWQQKPHLVITAYTAQYSSKFRSSLYRPPIV